MQKPTPPTISGAITSYAHSNGSIGVIVEVTCKSDFTARSEEFNELTHNIALQIAATNPKFIRKADIPDRQADNSDSDSDLKALSVELSLYEQPFIKDNSITVSQLIIGYALKLREDIAVTRFVRFGFGDPAITVAEIDSHGQQPGGGDPSGVTARLPKSPNAGKGAAHVDLDSGSSSQQVDG